MTNPRRLSTMPAPLWPTAILATLVGCLAAFGSAGIENTGAAASMDISAPSLPTELAGAPQPTSMLNDDFGQTDVAMAELPDAAAVAAVVSNGPEPVVETVSTTSPEASPTEAAPVQIAMADPGIESLTTPARASVPSKSSTSAWSWRSCVDRYLWALYQRTPKEDTIKEQERRKVSVKKRGKMVTVTRTFTKLVDEDFSWKDPKAAQKAGMSMMDYVIGGMDRSFKLKLFHSFTRRRRPACHRASPARSVTTIANRSQAASRRRATGPIHGGSSRGGYGHGLAADIVSVQGGDRDKRFTSSEKLWKWVDANGKKFGIGRPYLGRDPPHVAPVDGREYAAPQRRLKACAIGLEEGQAACCG